MNYSGERYQDLWSSGICCFSYNVFQFGFEDVFLFLIIAVFVHCLLFSLV